MKSLLSVLFSALFSLSAAANNPHHHSAMPMHANAMQQELMQGMQMMHDDMAKGMAYEDADAAFAASMIPHHQGAIKMAEIELKYGKDPELRKLAQAIIDAQESEIKLMQEWLKKNVKRKEAQ